MSQVKLKITKTDNSILEVDRFSGLQSVESLSQSTPDASSLYYGCLANSGSAKIVDEDGEIKTLIEDGDLENSNTNVDLLVDNNLVQKHITVDSDYNEENILSLQFTNKIEYWDKINYIGYSYPDEPKTAYEMLEDVLGATNGLGYTSTEINDMLSEEILYGNPIMVGTIKSYLQRITIPYPYLKSDTYRNTIDKFCRVAQLQVYQKDDGTIKFVSARPITTSSRADDAIVVPKYAQIKKLNKSIVLKNKYDAVEIQEKKANDIIKYDEMASSNLIDRNNISYTFITHNYVGGVPSGQSYAVAEKLEAYYTQGDFNLYKNSDYNLSQILSASTTGDADENGYYTLSKRDNKFTFSVNYDKTSGSFINNSQAISDIGNISNSNNTFATTEYYSKVNFNNDPDDTFKGQIPVSYTPASEHYSTAISIPNSNYIKIKDMGDYFNVKYYILSRVVFYDLDLNFAYPMTATSFKNTPRIYKNEAVSIDISIYGNKRTISFEDISASDDTLSAKTIANIQGSELLQTDTKYRVLYGYYIKMSDLIKYNIKNDYAKGISNGSIPLFCIDYKDTNNNVVVDFENGKILQTNDILSIQGEDKLWNISSREFNYDGQSIVNSKVKEVKCVKFLNFKQMLFNLNSSGSSTTYYFQPEDGETYDIINDNFCHLGLTLSQEPYQQFSFPYLTAYVEASTPLGVSVDLLEIDHPGGLVITERVIGSVTLYKDRIQIDYNETYYRGASVKLTGTIYYTRVIG